MLVTYNVAFEIWIFADARRGYECLESLEVQTKRAISMPRRG